MLRTNPDSLRSRAGCLETCLGLVSVPSRSRLGLVSVSSRFRLGLVSVSLCQCLVSVSELESLAKWSCLDRDMKKFWI